MVAERWLDEWMDEGMNDGSTNGWLMPCWMNDGRLLDEQTRESRINRWMIKKRLMEDLWSGEWNDRWIN